jgi:primosomal protein N'
LDKLEQDLKDMIKEKNIPLFHLESSSADLETIINNFNNSQNGILIGTSSILRPQIQNVENTAILNIDNLFGIPDFKTEEKILTLI